MGSAWAVVREARSVGGRAAAVCLIAAAGLVACAAPQPPEQLAAAANAAVCCAGSGAKPLCEIARPMTVGALCVCRVATPGGGHTILQGNACRVQ